MNAVNGLIMCGFMLGASIGSFLNVVFCRVPNGMSIVKPRSHCPACGKTIAWYFNIPILSYVLLQGKCHSCKSHIKIKYFLFEAAFGIMGMIITYQTIQRLILKTVV